MAAGNGTVVFVGVLLILAVVALSAFFYGWLIMLAFGIVHSFADGVPAIGFWQATGIGLVFGILTGAVFRRR